MRKCAVMLFVFICVSVFVFGAGEKEAVESYEMIKPIDSTSNDVLMQKGLPELADKPITIELITVYSGAAYEVMEKEFTNLVNSHYPNITLEMQPVESGELVQIVNTRLAAGNPPELVHCGGSYFLEDWAEAGALVDLSSMWNNYELETLVPSGIASSYTFNDTYFGIPFLSEQSDVMFYNINVLEEAGAPLPPYDNWEEFFDAAEKFRSASDKSFWAGGYNPAWFGFSKTIALAAARFGTDVYERVLNGKATTDDFSNMLKFHAKLYGYMNGGYVSMNAITGGSEEVGRGWTRTSCFMHGRRLGVVSIYWE